MGKSRVTEWLLLTVIVGILIAIAIPLYYNLKNEGPRQHAKQSLRAAAQTYERCYRILDSYPVTRKTVHTMSYELRCGTQSLTVRLLPDTNLEVTANSQALYLRASSNAGSARGPKLNGHTAYTYARLH